MTSARVGDDRLHWNLRSIGYVRRTKEQVLPRLPSKRRDTIPLILANEQQYRLAESDVIAWLQTLPLDFKTLDAKVAAALRSEQLVRLNNLRQLAAVGKLPTALNWIADSSPRASRWSCSPTTSSSRKRCCSASPARHILGADSAESRQGAIDDFQREDGPQLIVCSLRAGSQGITLTRASNVAFMELDWTPARHDRAEDRLHRIGRRGLGNGLVPAGPAHNRRIDGRGTRAKAHPDRRGDGWSGARRGAAGGRGGAGAEGAAAETRSRGWDQAGADSGLGAPHSCTPPSQLGPPARVTCAPVRFEHNA